MKYNPDCVRKTLLMIEQEVKIEENDRGFFDEQHLWLPRLFELLANEFGKPDILYSLLKLEEAGYIETNFYDAPENIDPQNSEITAITFKGHEFLENIREDRNWARVKEAGRKAGSLALSLLSDVAKSLVIEIAKAALLG